MTSTAGITTKEIYQIIKQIESIGIINHDLGNAYEDGLTAYNDKLTLDECKYPKGTIRRAVWEQAWLIQSGWAARIGAENSIHQLL